MCVCVCVCVLVLLCFGQRQRVVVEEGFVVVFPALQALDSVMHTEKIAEMSKEEISSV